MPRIRTLCSVLLVCGLHTGAAWGQQDAYIELDKVRVLAPSSLQKHAVFAARHGPYVLLNETVYDLKTGAQMAHVEKTKYAPRIRRALSPDGRFYVVCVPGLKTSLQVSDTKAGKTQTIELLGRGNSDVFWMDFIAPDKLLWVGRLDGTNVVRIHQIPGGKVEREFVQSAYIHAAALTPDCSQLALASQTNLLYLDLATFKTHGLLRLPDNPLGMAFAPDGKSLAMTLEDDKRLQFLYLTSKGSPQVDLSLPPARMGQSRFPHAIQFTPDGRFALVEFRYLIDLKFGCVAWEFDYPNNKYSPPVVIVSNDKLLYFEENPRQIVLVDHPIPRDELEEAVRRVNPADPLLRAGKGVKLDLQFGAVVLGTPENVRKEVLAAVTERLAEHQFKVDAKSALTLAIHYDEDAPEGTKIVVGVGDDAKVVAETTRRELVCTCTLKHMDGREVWRDAWRFGNISYTRVEFDSPANRRSQLTRALSTGFARIQFPSMVSKHPNAPALPLRGAPQASSP